MSKQEKLYNLFNPIVNQMGYECYNVELKKNGKKRSLIIYIDHPDGIKIEDCEKVSREISRFLDSADPIEGAYTLEVSSPGIERQLSRIEHYQAAIGEKIDISLFRPINKMKKICAVLEEVDDEGIVVRFNHTTLHFDFTDIAKANIHFDFD